MKVAHARSVFALLAAALFTAAAPAHAAVKVLRVADPNMTGSIVIEFQPKETAAVVLTTAAADYPLRLLRATVRAGPPIFSTRGHTGTGTMRLHVWRDIGAVDPGAQLYESPQPVAVMTGDNTFDFSADGITVDSGNLRVGFEIVQEGADVATDSGMTAGKNYILGKQTGTADTFRWQASPGGLLGGDFIISLEVETQGGDGGTVITLDAGTRDAGVVDVDAGIPGVEDAGVAPADAGSSDAGTMRADGGAVRHPQSGCFCDARAGSGATGGAGLAAFAVACALFALRRQVRRRASK